MLYVTTVRNYVKFSGSLLEAFTPTGGLRQGNPLSSFLFLFVAEGLLDQLRAEVEVGGTSLLKVCRSALGISHLLFADDTLLFFKAEVGEANRVNEVIKKYAMSTGQLVNASKCSIQFTKKCPVMMQLRISEALNIQKEGFEDKYLGLPTPDDRMHMGKFQKLQEQLAKRILLWGDMSQGGKEVMIKVIAQSLASYIMGVFKPPFFVCDDLMKLVHDFWWGSSVGTRKTHWIGWSKLRRSKLQGGMGFRDMHISNQALLACQSLAFVAITGEFVCSCAAGEILSAGPPGRLRVYREPFVDLGCYFP
jgi:hypothetical protein